MPVYRREDRRPLIEGLMCRSGKRSERPRADPPSSHFPRVPLSISIEEKMSAARIPVIGIVGGIGSGKTAVAEALSAHLRCCRIDADAAGHRALERSDVQQQLRTLFGEAIFDGQRRLVRAAVARRVFGDAPETRLARRQLEEIVHPHIQRDATKQLQQLQQSGACDVILLDAALLLEAGWHEMCHAVVFLDVPLSQRQARVAARGWSREEHQRREASQLPVDEKKRRADFVLDNSQDLPAAAATLARWISDTFLQPPQAQFAQTCC